jgi:hypothetical protein
VHAMAAGAIFGHNGPLPRAEPPPAASALAATPEETAAIVAALERFMRATAPTHALRATPVDGWRAVAIRDGVSRDPWDGTSSPDLRDPWINT